MSEPPAPGKRAAGRRRRFVRHRGDDLWSETARL